MAVPARLVLCRGTWLSPTPSPWPAHPTRAVWLKQRCSRHQCSPAAPVHPEVPPRNAGPCMSCQGTQAPLLSRLRLSPAASPVFPGRVKCCVHTWPAGSAVTPQAGDSPRDRGCDVPAPPSHGRAPRHSQTSLPLQAPGHPQGTGAPIPVYNLTPLPAPLSLWGGRWGSCSPACSSSPAQVEAAPSQTGSANTRGEQRARSG